MFIYIINIFHKFNQKLKSINQPNMPHCFTIRVLHLS